MFEEEIFFISNKNIWTPATRKQADTLKVVIFWMTHNPNFRENMMPQKLLFSIGPPALLSFICLEKKAVLYLINISEYQRQIKQAATSEFYHSCITHNSNFRTNMMLQRLLFFDSVSCLLCYCSYVRRRNIFVSNKHIWTSATAKQAASSEFIIFWWTHNLNFRENMMLKNCFFRSSRPLCCRSYVWRINLSYT